MSSSTTLRLRRPRHWYITLSNDEAQWGAWRAGNFVALGWDELGDVSRLRRREFEQRRTAIVARFPERSKASADLVWRFAHHIHEGDRIVVADFDQVVLGIGTVTGPYYFLPDVYKGHCLPVDWDDLRRRQVALPHWRRMLVELSLEQFSAIQQAPAVVEPPSLAHRLAETPAPYEVAPPTPTPSDAQDHPAGPGEPEAAPPFTIADLAAAVGQEVDVVTGWVRAIERKGQLIFAGPPGVGKTFAAHALARHLVAGGDGFWEAVQFHAAYSYEDFVQGLRPHTSPTGQLAFRLEPGRFLSFCQRAGSRSGRCVLLIDEINRAPVARIFGELLYLLEYRDQAIRLAAGEPPFQIPANVRLVGTMNTADRSIALVDFALRRRFAFVELEPNFEALARFHRDRVTGFPVDALIRQLKRVNQAIGAPAFALGTSYFLRTDLCETLPDIWRLEIEPYLAEYFFDQPERMDEFRWRRIQSDLGVAPV
jgi:DNA polymerase III delta prime subunit